MKALKVVGIISAVIVAVVFGGGFLMPSKWTVARSIVIDAPAERISPFIADLHQWEKWAAWNNKMDPEAKWTFFGASSGEGAKMAWTGPKMGVGILTLEKVDAASIAYTMQMEGELTGEGENTRMEKGGTPSTGRFTFSAEGEGTRVTWKDEGDMGGNPVARWFVPVMESMLGSHFEIGLKNLKQVAEAAAPAEKVAEEAAPAEGEAEAVAQPAAP